MKVISNPAVMQREALRMRREGRRIVLVPTMGALHQGHLSLVKLARRRGDTVVLSIYVNPTQFGPKEDFAKYPRPFSRDRQLAAAAGVDILFAPKNLYAADADRKSTRLNSSHLNAADASAAVTESALSLGRCGAFRPGHFNGVTTVVAKLFNLVQPVAAVFGQKDAQQCDVLERMARDLNFPVNIIRAPIVRDANGVALSSRNAYLSAAEYETAKRFAAALKQSAAVGDARRKLAAVGGLRVQYVEAANGRLCAAVVVGRTRLIDNVGLKKSNKPEAKGNMATRSEK
jgi:pantoate--beta-alanine ligase